MRGDGGVVHILIDSRKQGHRITLTLIMSQTQVTPTPTLNPDAVDGLYTPITPRSTFTINSDELSEVCERTTGVLKDAKGTCQALEDKNEQGKCVDENLKKTIENATVKDAKLEETLGQANDAVANSNDVFNTQLDKLKRRGDEIGAQLNRRGDEIGAQLNRQRDEMQISLNGVQAGVLAVIGKICHPQVQPPHVQPTSKKPSGESSVWSTFRSATKMLPTLKTPSMVTLGTLGTTLGTSTLFQLCGLPSPQVYAQFLSTLVPIIPGGLWLYILTTLVLFGGIYLCMSRIQACFTRFRDSVSNQLSEMWHSTKTKCSEIGDSICTTWKNVTDTILKGWSKFCSFCSNYWPAFQWCLYATIGIVIVVYIVYYWTTISTFFAAAYTTVSPYITTAKDMSMNATNTIITTTSDGYEWTLSTWVKPSSQEWYDYLSFQAKRLAQEAAEKEAAEKEAAAKEAASATTMGMVTSFFAKSLKSTSVRNIREAAVTMGGSITMGLGIIAFVLCFE